MGIASVFAARNSHRVDIPVIGDSITFGRDASAFTDIWTQQLSQLVRAAYPTANGSAGGLGFVPAFSTDDTILFTWPISNTGSPTLFDTGAVRASALFTDTGTLTWTAPAATTSIQVPYLDGSDPGVFTVQVGDDSPVTVTNGVTGAEKLTDIIPVTEGQLVTISWVSGTVVIDGILHYNGDESTGITFHGCGRSGWCAGTETGIGWNAPEEYSLNWMQCYANGFPSTQAFCILLGTNDGNTVEGDRTAAEFQSDLEAFIADIRGSDTSLASVPLLLIGAWELEAMWADAGGWPAYGTAIANAAAADGNAQFVNLADFMPSAFDSPYPDIYQPDDVGHPNDSGELVIAQAVFGQILPAAGSSSLVMAIAAGC